METALALALAAATRRAETAEKRAAHAEEEVNIAREQSTAFKLTIAALQHRLEETTPPAGPEPAAKMNRQARRAAERDAHRRRQ